MAGHKTRERDYIKMVDNELERAGIARYKYVQNKSGHLVVAFENSGHHQRMVFGPSTDPRAIYNARGQLRRMIRQHQPQETAA